jgi:hypothetical protein
LSSLTVSSSSVVGQASPTGTVTLSAAAPAGGASIRLESSNIDVARVPANVTVSAGSTSASFPISTATVDTKQTVTLTATYADLARTATLQVTLIRPRAAFTVISPTLGNDRCRMIEHGSQLDCRLDGRSSDGRIVRWDWALEVQERVTTSRPDPAFNEIDVHCEFIKGRTGDTDASGRYTTMKVDLEVTDKDGDRDRTSRDVRLYFDEVCEDEDDD